MVEQQLRARGVTDPAVLAAFAAVPREQFVPAAYAEEAYRDEPLPIGEGQTISQPYVVGVMVEALEVQPGDRVLEVGAGSGYAAAVLAELGARVVAVERRSVLAAAARDRLAALGYDNVEVHEGDGTQGWAAAAPFDAILVSAGGIAIPPALPEQLAAGGRLVIPVGEHSHQRLLRLVKAADGRLSHLDLGAVSFVPLVSGSEG